VDAFQLADMTMLLLLTSFASVALAAAGTRQHDHCLLASRFQMHRAQDGSLAQDLGENTSEAATCSADVSCPPCGVEGSCMLWGDPHVYVFDKQAHIRVVEQGDFWIVRSDCVEIQGRYAEQGVITAVAVGGSFLQGHIFALEPSVGRSMWDGHKVLTGFPSTFTIEGLIHATYSDQGKHVDPGLGGLPLKSVELELPLGIRLTVNRWPEHLDVLITMRPLPGGQDGHCGNFNGDSSDDSLELIQAREGGAPVPKESRLIPLEQDPSEQNDPVVIAFDALENCGEEKRAKAEQLCKSTGAADYNSEVDPRDALESCIFDVCFAGAQFAREDEVIAKQMAERASASSSAECTCEPTTTTTASSTTATSTATTLATTPLPPPTTTTPVPPPTTAAATTTTTTTATTTTTTTTASTTTTTSSTVTATVMTTTTAATTSTTASTTVTTTTTTTTQEEISCFAFGDPHVVSFDKARKMRELGSLGHEEMWTRVHEVPFKYEEAFYDSGEFWFVRSSEISIQARYGPPGGWIREVVVGGPFLQGHKFSVNTDDSVFLDKVLMTWDGERVLTSFPGEFSIEGLISARYIENDFYQETKALTEPGHWRSGTELRSLEVTFPSDVKLTVNLGIHKSAFIDVFVTMRKQPDGQGGHCGSATGDDVIDWDGAAVAPGETLLSPIAGLLQHAVVAHGTNSKASNSTAHVDTTPDECLAGSQEEHRALCESVLNQTGNAIPLLFLDACAMDVCVGGPEMLYHVAAVAHQAYHKVVARAAGATNCDFAVDPGQPYMWDPTCSMGALGCMADGKNVQCRFCGFGDYKDIACP